MKELKMCVVLLDMDRLKSINDKYGHSAGDRALMELAEGLKKCFGRGFHVMRLGGGRIRRGPVRQRSRPALPQTLRTRTDPRGPQLHCDESVPCELQLLVALP